MADGSARIGIGRGRDRKTISVLTRKRRCPVMGHKTLAKTSKDIWEASKHKCINQCRVGMQARSLRDRGSEDGCLFGDRKSRPRNSLSSRSSMGHAQSCSMDSRRHRPCIFLLFDVRLLLTTDQAACLLQAKNDSHFQCDKMPKVSEAIFPIREPSWNAMNTFQPWPPRQANSSSTTKRLGY